MKIQDKITLSVAEAVKKVLAPDVKLSEGKMKELHALMKKGVKDPKKIAKELGLASTKEVFSAIEALIKKEAEIAPKDQEFHDLHTVDVKEAKLAEYDFEEGNEFTAAAAKAKLAGEDEFEFDGKTYPTEISQDAAEKILGKKEKSNVNEIEIDPITGKLIGAGAPKKESVELDEKVKPNLTKIVNIRREIVKVQTKIDQAIFDGDPKTVDKLGDELHKLRKKLVNFYNEGVDVEELDKLEEDVDNFFGFTSKDKLVKFQSMAKKLRIKPIGNPTIMKRMGTEYHVMPFKGKVRDIEKAIKVASEVEKESA